MAELVPHGSFNREISAETALHRILMDHCPRCHVVDRDVRSQDAVLAWQETSCMIRVLGRPWTGDAPVTKPDLIDLVAIVPPVPPSASVAGLRIQPKISSHAAPAISHPMCPGHG